jgi:hypothetical protein
MAKRTLTIELIDAPEVENSELRESAADVTRWLRDEYGFAEAWVTLHGQAGRGGWKTESLEV